MSGKELSSVPLQHVGNGLNAPPPLAVQDADPLRFRVGDPDPKTREFATFIGDHHRYFAAAPASAPLAHRDFRQHFYSGRPFHGNPPDSGGSDDHVDEDDNEDDDVEGQDCHVGRQSNATNKDVAGGGISAGIVAEPENAVYYSQYLKTTEGSSGSGQKDTAAAENGCGFSGRKETSSSSNSMESLRAILSDPITGALMGDAMILPCGHSFGAGGIEQVKQMKSCCTCSQSVSDDLITPNLSLRIAVQAFCRAENLHLNSSSKRKREASDQDKRPFGVSSATDQLRNRNTQFPFIVADRVIIKGNKRTPPRFVGREAIVTTQCLNGWYVVKTLDNAESVKLQYRSLAKASEDTSVRVTHSKMVSNWL